jgi:hypothetical protein
MPHHLYYYKLDIFIYCYIICYFNFLIKGAETPVFLARIKFSETNGGEFWSKMKKLDWEHDVTSFVITD